VRLLSFFWEETMERRLAAILAADLVGQAAGFDAR
jgi:hypothetical protein